MVSEKVLRFQGKKRDLDQLASQIETQLQSEGYATQHATIPLGRVIQARKSGVLREIIAADRAFTIMISGSPDDFAIRIGIGKWIANVAITAAEAIFLSYLFLVIDVPEMLWTCFVEAEIISEITRIVG